MTTPEPLHGKTDESNDEKPWPSLRGCLKGKMWIDPDYDFTRPTFLDYAREVDEADGLTPPAANAIVDAPKAPETDMTNPEPLHAKANDELHSQPAAAKPRSQADSADAADDNGDEKPWPPLLGCMEGEMWIDPDYDFTRPTFLDYAREVGYK